MPRCPAGRSPSPGGVGWRGLSLRTNKGADSGFRRTACIPPRRAKRRAQVCGDSTVQNDGHRAGSPHPPQAVPLPLRGEGLNAAQDGRDFPCRTRHSACPASEALPHPARPREGALLHERRRGEAHCRQGWVGGVYPSAHLKARTAASDGQRAFTRAARSAGLRFAVSALSKTVDFGRDHLIHRGAVPLPRKDS